MLLQDKPLSPGQAGEGGFLPDQGGEAEQALQPRKKAPKIYYATRTHSQIAQVVRELKRSKYHPKMAVLVGGRVCGRACGWLLWCQCAVDALRVSARGTLSGPASRVQLLGGGRHAAATLGLCSTPGSCVPREPAWSIRPCPAPAMLPPC